MVSIQKNEGTLWNRHLLLTEAASKLREIQNIFLDSPPRV